MVEKTGQPQSITTRSRLLKPAVPRISDTLLVKKSIIAKLITPTMTYHFNKLRNICTIVYRLPILFFNYINLLPFGIPINSKYVRLLLVFSELI